jgi:hypothetical protein
MEGIGMNEKSVSGTKDVTINDLQDMAFCEECVHFESQGAIITHCRHPSNKKIMADYRSWFISNRWGPAIKNSDNKCTLFRAKELT